MKLYSGSRFQLFPVLFRKCVSCHIHLSFVGVRFFSIDSVVFFDVVEGVVHHSSVTAIVAILGRAVDEILFAERYKFSSLTEVLSFQRSSLTRENNIINST